MPGDVGQTRDNIGDNCDSAVAEAAAAAGASATTNDDNDNDNDDDVDDVDAGLLVRHVQ